MTHLDSDLLVAARAGRGRGHPRRDARTSSAAAGARPSSARCERAVAAGRRGRRTGLLEAARPARVGRHRPGPRPHRRGHHGPGPPDRAAPRRRGAAPADPAAPPPDRGPRRGRRGDRPARRRHRHDADPPPPTPSPPRGSHAFPDWPGSAAPRCSSVLPDGEQVVDVRTTLRPDGSTDHEVWLMTAGARRLVSLGTLQRHERDASWCPPASTSTATGTSTSRTSRATATPPTPATRSSAGPCASDAPPAPPEPATAVGRPSPLARLLGRAGRWAQSAAVPSTPAPLLRRPGLSVNWSTIWDGIAGADPGAHRDPVGAAADLVRRAGGPGGARRRVAAGAGGGARRPGRLPAHEPAGVPDRDVRGDEARRGAGEPQPPVRERGAAPRRSR